MLHLVNSRSVRDSEARSDEPGNEQEERQHPGSSMAQLDKGEEYGVEELRVEELSGVSWSLEDLFGDDDHEYAGEKGCPYYRMIAL